MQSRCSVYSFSVTVVLVISWLASSVGRVARNRRNRSRQLQEPTSLHRSPDSRHRIRRRESYVRKTGDSSPSDFRIAKPPVPAGMFLRRKSMSGLY